MIRVLGNIMWENQVGLISCFVAQPIRWAMALVGGVASPKQYLAFSAAPPLSLVELVFSTGRRYYVLKRIPLVFPARLANSTRPSVVAGKQAHTLFAAKPFEVILRIFWNVMR